jgi:ATP-dependent DNA helicase RecG
MSNRPRSKRPLQQRVVSAFTAQDRSERSLERSSEKSSEKIIAIIRRDPAIAAQYIANQMGLTSRAVEKHLSKLKAEGRIHRVGPDKGGHWEVKQ